MADRRVVYSTEQAITRKPARRSGVTKQPPAGQGVRICYERKGRGGKVVCVVTGLPLDAGALRALSKRLKAALGTGGAVKDGHIEIQGDHRPKLMALLEREGFRPKFSGG